MSSGIVLIGKTEDMTPIGVVLSLEAL